MRPQSPRSILSNRGPRLKGVIALCVLVAIAAGLLTSCGAVQQPGTTPFYAETAPPPAAEFRWSNGKPPKSLDPALAAASPETDVVRAIFEGLTEIDPKTLEARPAVAVKWTADETSTTWTFLLRASAKWSNGRPVIARDFERSWQRLAALGPRAAHTELLANFKRETFRDKGSTKGSAGAAEGSTEGKRPAAAATPAPSPLRETAIDRTSNAAEPPSAVTPASPPRLAVKAVDDATLSVTLEKPDPDLPKLVAHAIFRPVFDRKQSFDPAAASSLVTNGAFHVSDAGADGIVLERSASYWNAGKVTLERVRFVPAETAEVALDAYRRGELDAVTNFEFAPAVLKLLEPYSDFQRKTHGALNLYEINHRKYPFDDRRVREALAAAIERERLTETELGGATRPAFQFLPFRDDTAESVVQDARYAAELLSDAGFPGGENFPRVRLVVNRNDVQLRIARSVARMWKQTLNIETEIVIKEPGEIDEIRKDGDFDLIRRGVVLPTADELASLNAILDDARPETPAARSPAAINPPADTSEAPLAEPGGAKQVVSQDDELFRLYAIPLYFPTSYSLVKPYVAGFEMGGLDAPVLGDVRVDNQWQPKKAAAESN